MEPTNMEPIGTLAVKRIIRFENDTGVKALCDVSVCDQFLIRGVRIVNGRNGTFVSMPRQQGKNGKWYDTVTMLKPSVKEEMQRALMEAYEKPD